MCGRFGIWARIDAIQDLFNVKVNYDYQPRYNIAPQTDVPTIRNDEPDVVNAVEWGFIAPWDAKKRLINARSETAAEKQTFKNAFADRRCLILSTGYYEWQSQPAGSKQPYLIHRVDNEPFAFAGLWNPSNGYEKPTCTILTTEPSSSIENIHDRMPVMLERDTESVWLSEDDPEKGYDVLLLDRASFPSDTISTFIIKYPGVAQLEKWGLLEAVEATNCPPLRRFTAHVVDGPVSGNPPPEDGVPMNAPRRNLLDKILVDAAVEAGAELREEFVVRELLTKGDRVTGIKGQPKGGTATTEEARIVVGADGRNSLVARSVDAPAYDDQPPQAFYYYTFWPNLPVDGLEYFWRHHRFVLAIPTNDELTCLVAGRPIEYFQEFAADVRKNYRETINIAPKLAEAIADVEPMEPYIGMDVPNYFKKPYGAGWALVGDAGLCMDPLQGHGISDAICDAELVTDAIDAGFSDREPLEEALADYERRRNERKEPYYEGNWKGAQMEGWDAPENRRLHQALRENPAKADQWSGVQTFKLDAEEWRSSEFVTQAKAGPEEEDADGSETNVDGTEH